MHSCIWDNSISRIPNNLPLLLFIAVNGFSIWMAETQLFQLALNIPKFNLLLSLRFLPRRCRRLSFLMAGISYSASLPMNDSFSNWAIFCCAPSLRPPLSDSGLMSHCEDSYVAMSIGDSSIIGGSSIPRDGFLTMSFLSTLFSLEISNDIDGVLRLLNAH